MNRTVLILRHIPQETAGTLETALTNVGLEVHYVDLFCQVPERLPLDEAAGLVVLGGPMNADEVERYPFLKLDVQWIQQAIETKLPLMGICLGLQLMAKALGAKVYKNAVKEIGWYPLEWLPATADDPLFARNGGTTIFQWHGDTFDLPPGAVWLAKSRFVPEPSVSMGLERLRPAIPYRDDCPDDRRLAREGDESGELAALDYISPQTIRESTPEFLPNMQRFAAEMFGGFARMCLASGKV